MLRPVIAATAVLIIANCSNAFAQAADDERGPQSECHHRLSAADIKAFTDARIAAFKAGLQLTSDQEKNWPPFEEAVRDLANLRIERMRAREEGMETRSDPFDRLQRHAEAMSRTSAALKRLADAGTPIYQSLSDAQKHRFMLLAHVLRPHWMAGGPHGMMGLPHGTMRGGSGGMMNSDDGGPHHMPPPDYDDDNH